MDKRESISDADFRAALGSWASGVSVVTATFGGERHGLTVSGFVSVSRIPPIVSVCINRQSALNSLVEQARAFAVNILASQQRELSHRFASRYDGDRFEGFDVQLGSVLGCPIFDGCLAAIECQLAQSVEVGDHHVYFGHVVGSQVSKRDPLLYYQGAYREIIYGRRGNERE